MIIKLIIKINKQLIIFKARFQNLYIIGLKSLIIQFLIESKTCKRQMQGIRYNHNLISIYKRFIIINLLNLKKVL